MTLSVRTLVTILNSVSDNDDLLGRIVTEEPKLFQKAANYVEQSTKDKLGPILKQFQAS